MGKYRASYVTHGGFELTSKTVENLLSVFFRNINYIFSDGTHCNAACQIIDVSRNYFKKIDQIPKKVFPRKLKRTFITESAF